MQSKIKFKILKIERLKFKFLMAKSPKNLHKHTIDFVSDCSDIIFLSFYAFKY
jgi:hypothetical protein